MTTRVSHMRYVARELGGSPWEVTGDRLTQWAGRQDWAIETRRSYRGSMLAFWRWAVAAGRTDSNPAAALPRVKPAPPRPRPAPEIVYAEALRRAQPRERLMLRLAAEVGLRRHEVAKVHTRDVVEDLEGWSLVVKGKGGRVRTLPLPVDLARELRAHRRGYVFPGEDEGHLSARWVGKLITGLLPGVWTMHTLRHRFGTRAYLVDRDVFAVQELLGHASPATTRAYVEMPRDTLRRTVQAVSRGA
ncbi:tyrosine-type recombinase/integrase [Nocardia otitidiscaviarum]|uniref:tyrosine-type recombinase/integrase n=1 Tax=Nocardia otitidiscaviarum TaxID=1823 RepID=UPI001F41BC17|nr:site-specific integrase [Nocardia otitidiscaviarum]